MNGLLVLGAGGHGKVVADAALSMGWRNVAFIDDRGKSMPAPLGLPVLGTLNELHAVGGGYDGAVVAVGDAKLRLILMERCRGVGLAVVSIIHPSAFVSKFASLGPGCVVLAQSAVNADARLGSGCIVNTGATVDHDCLIGDAVHICPGAHLAGNVQVGACAWIGIAASVRQGISIGRGATVAAGAVVVETVADDVTVMGVPAKSRGVSA